MPAMMLWPARNLCLSLSASNGIEKQHHMRNYTAHISAIIFILLALNCCGQDKTEYTRMLIRIGDKAVSEGHPDEAITSYSLAIMMDDKSIPSYIRRASAYADKADFDQALEDYHAALSLKPEYAPFYGMITVIYYEKGDIDSAIETIEAGIRVDNNHPVLYILRGLLFEKKVDCERALENYRTARSHDPEKFNTSTNIAWVLATCPDRKVRNGSEALKIMKSVIVEEKTDDTYRTIAAAYAETGDFLKAIEMQEKALELLQIKKAPSAWMQKDKKRDFEAYTKELRAYKEGKEWRLGVTHP